jgi:hypothetical protein
MVSVRERTIPTERPPLVGEVIAKILLIFWIICTSSPHHENGCKTDITTIKLRTLVSQGI